MHRSRYERLAHELKMFKKAIQKGKDWRDKVFGSEIITKRCSSKEEDIQQANGDIVNTTAVEIGVSEWELKSLLHCMNEQDFLNESRQQYIAYEKNKDEDSWKNYKKYVNNYESSLWKNADQNSYPLYLKYIKGRTKNLQSKSKKYLFHAESLFSYLRRLRQFINSSDSSVYHKRIARELFSNLKVHLFEKVDFSEQEKQRFMVEWELLIPRKREWKALKTNPGRRPLIQQQCKDIILLAMDKFIETLTPLYAETLLYSWVAQSGARTKRRGFNVSDILKIRLCDLRGTPKIHKTYPEIKAKEGKILANEKPLLTSMQLMDFIEAYADERKPSKPIFSHDRSSLENSLKELTQELGYNLEKFPVTPETFLEKCRPNDHR